MFKFNFLISFYNNLKFSLTNVIIYIQSKFEIYAEKGPEADADVLEEMLEVDASDTEAETDAEADPDP